MPTVREFAARFLDHQAMRTKPLTYKRQCATVNDCVVPALGKFKLDEIRQQHLDGLVTAWSETCKAPTVNTRLSVVRRLLSLAVEWEILARAPKCNLLKVGETAPRFLTDTEMKALVEAAEPQWQAMILVGLRSGLRIGELRGLRWEDIDFVRGLIRVRRTEPGRKTMDATTPKGGRDRAVPLTGDSRRALAEIWREGASGWIWPALQKRRSETRARARSDKGCWDAIARAAKRAGLEGVAWHTLRHTYASHLVMRGVPLRQVQQWLGHASIRETEKYSHLYPDHGHAEASLLDTPLRQTAAKRGSRADESPSNVR